MGSSTKPDVQGILAQRNKQVKIESLQFELKQQNQKLERLRIEHNNLKIENEKLKAELAKLKEDNE